MKRIVAIAALATALTLPAHAQRRQACMPFKEISDHLAEKYHEQPTSVGLVNQTTAVQVFASPDGATWTIVSIRTDGRACIMASGVGWQNVPNPKDGGTGI